MPVANLQTWADHLETIRLPMLESTIESVQETSGEIQVLLSAKIQEFSDNFDTHSARITGSQSKADLAKVFADDALVRIYAGDLDSRSYTDTRIQNLRDELNLGIGTLQTYVDGTYATATTAEIAAQVAAALAVIDTKSAEIDTILGGINVEFDSIRDVNDQILNEELPTQAVLVGEIHAELAEVKARADLTLAGFEYDTFLEAIDDTQARAADSLIPLGVSILQAPASGWTTASTSATFEKAPISSAWFVQNDLALGRCVELPAGSDVTIGQAYPADFAADRVYQVRVRIRVIGNGTTSGARIHLGVSTWAGATPAQLNIEKSITIGAIPAGTQDLVYTCIFSGNLAKLNDQEYSVGTAAANTAVHLSGSASANKAFFHVRQNPVSVTNGQIRVGVLEVKDITPAIDAAKVIKTRLQADLGEVTATLETVSFAISDMDLAIAGITTRLDSRSLPNMIGDPDLSEPVASAWESTLGATLTVVTHGQTGTTNTKAVRARDAADGQAGFYSLPHLVGNFGNRLLRFRGKARASATGIDLYGGTWLWRLGAADNLTNLLIMPLTTNFQPFDVVIRALTDAHLDTDGLRLRFYHTGGAAGAWSEVTDLEVYDITGSEISIYDIVAGLSSVYYTQTETDLAIAESITSYNATIINPTTGELNASLLTDYYTRVEADSAVSAAINSFEAEYINLGTGQIKATALTGYYTKAENNTAMSTMSTTLSAATTAKGKIIYSTTAPGVGDRLTQNLWIDTTGGANTPKRWNGTTWVAVSDKLASDAAAAVISINSNISTNYYTKTATDAAIAGMIDTFEAEFRNPLTGQIKATALNEYYTRAAADSATSTATLALKSSMEGPGGSVNAAQEDANTALASVTSLSATLTTSYTTTTNMNAAISSAATVLRASMEAPGGSVGLAQSAAAAANASAHIAFGVAEGKGKVLFQSTSPLMADRLDQNLWIDTTGGANTPKRWNGSTWMVVSDKAATDAVAAAALSLSQVATLSATLTNNYYTSVQVEAAKVLWQNELEARISNPSGTSLGALVQLQGAAITTLKGNATAMLAFRVKAGTGGAQLELVAQQNPSGSTSIARLTADNILLDGTVSARHIAVESLTGDRFVANSIMGNRMVAGSLEADRFSSGSGNNLLENSNFVQNMHGFVGGGSGGLYAQSGVGLRGPNVGWSGTNYQVLQIGQSGTATDGWSDIYALKMNSAGVGSFMYVPVTPGQWYSAGAQYSTHRCTGDLFIAWTDAAGGYISATSGSAIPTNSADYYNPNAWPRTFVKGQAPAGAAYAFLIFRKYGTLSGSNSYMMLHKPQLNLSHAAATVSPPYDLGGTTVIDGGNIRTGSITAASGVIGDLAVTTLNIAGSAVTTEKLQSEAASHSASASSFGPWTVGQKGPGVWLNCTGKVIHYSFQVDVYYANNSYLADYTGVVGLYTNTGLVIESHTLIVPRASRQELRVQFTTNAVWAGPTQFYLDFGGTLGGNGVNRVNFDQARITVFEFKR